MFVNYYIHVPKNKLMMNWLGLFIVPYQPPVSLGVVHWGVLSPKFIEVSFSRRR